MVSAITGSSKRSAVGQSGQVCIIAVAATVRVMQNKLRIKILKLLSKEYSRFNTKLKAS